MSTPNAQFMTMDISNFYLMTPLKQKEYIRIKISNIPEEIIIEYKLQDLITKDGSIYIQANKGMYGLPQLGLLANELLEKRLNRHGTDKVPGLWRHDTRPATDTIHTSSGRFRSQIHQQRRCTTPATSSRRALQIQNKNGLGQTKVQRNHPWLGLQAKKSTIHLSMPGTLLW